VGDRRFLVVDETGRFLTQRTLPRMARVTATLAGDALALSAEGAGTVLVSRLPILPRRCAPSAVCEQRGPASRGLWRRSCTLARRFSRAPVPAGPRRRRISPAGAQVGEGAPGDVFNFADGYPFMLVSEASLADLNRRAAGQGHPPLPMSRFRPNLVVAGAAPYAETPGPGSGSAASTFAPAGPAAAV